MIEMTVGDFKANFSSVLDKVMQGEEVHILYGRAKKPVAQLTQINTMPKRKKRPLGSYEGKASYWEDESFEITPEWLFDDMNDLM
ncbi:MAG: prevent-host-death protein [Treponema sp.]|nr:prevent-host-death protein [Treponema sp.]